MIKKFLLALIAVLASALGASAQNPTLYLVGENFGNWNADEQYKMTENNGVYTITVPVLKGEFKIFDGNWSNSDHTFTANNKQMATNTEYPCVSGDGPGNMCMSHIICDATVTFNYQNKKITVTGTPPVMFIGGDINGVTNWISIHTDLSHPIYQTASSNAFNATYVFTTDSWFRFVDGTNQYSPGSNDQEVVSGQTYKAVQSTDKAYKISAGTWHINATVNNDNTLSVTMTKVENLYILGYVAENGVIHGFTPDKGVQMFPIAEKPGTFTAKNVIFGYHKENGNYTTASYFSFSEKLSATESNWDAIKGYRHFASSANENVKLDEGMSIQMVNDHSFAIEPGVYDVTVNLADMKMSVTKANLKEVTSLSDLATNTDEYVNFTGTVFCEFNYASSNDGTSTLYLSDTSNEATPGVQITYNPSYANGQLVKDGVTYRTDLQPNKFNRGQTLTQFQLMRINGEYVIAGFTLNQDGLAQTTMVTDATNKIPQVSALSNAYVNKMVQVKGNVYYTSGNTGNKVTVDGKDISLIYDFTRPIDPSTDNGQNASVMAAGTSWNYGGNDGISHNGDELYVAGIVTNDLAINMTAMSETIIAGAEATEMDAETIVTVYNIQGMVVRRNVKYGEATRDLPAGLYIVAGKKLIVR